MNHCHGQSRGFVLLWTVVLLAFASVVLLTLTRRSLALAVSAVDAERRLQDKWALVSCRSRLLQDPEALLLAAERERNGPVQDVWLSATVGGATIEVCVADEQACVNVNTLYWQLGRRSMETVVQRLLAESGVCVPVLLRPDSRRAERRVTGASPASTAQSESSAAGSSILPFACWSQVVDSDDPLALLGSRTTPGVATCGLTCWGDGKLNLRRSSAPVAKVALGGVISPPGISRLLDARSRAPQASDDEWMAAAGLTADDRAALQRVVADRSLCHSVSIRLRDQGRIHSESTVVQEEIIGEEKGEGQPGGTSAGATTQPSEVRRFVFRTVW